MPARLGRILIWGPSRRGKSPRRAIQQAAWVGFLPRLPGLSSGGLVSSTGAVQFTGLAHHLLDLGDVALLKLDLLAGIFLQPHALVRDEREQIVVFLQRGAFVVQGFVENLDDVVFMRLDQLADSQRWVPTERCYMLASHRGVIHALRGLGAHPANDRNARVAEDHQGVVEVAYHSREL